MKPYKIASTWVDLDHVQGMADEVDWMPEHSAYVEGRVILAFRDAPLVVNLIRVRSTYEAGRLSYNEKDISRAKEMWESFKTAWKTKDTMFGSSK